MRATSGWRTTSALVSRLKNAMPWTRFKTRSASIRPESWVRGRSIWLMSPVMTALLPKPIRVRNIFICSGVVFCASSRITKAWFSVRPRMKASGAISICWRSKAFCTELVVAHQVVERIVQRPQVGVDLLRQVAGQEAQPLAGLDRRARQHDALHRAALERVDRAGDGEIGLAGAGRPDAECDVVQRHVVEVALLVGGATAHLAAARLHDVGLDARLGQRGVAAEHQLDLFRRDRVARSRTAPGSPPSPAARGLGALDAELLEAVRDLHLQRGLDGADMAVHGPAQVRHAFVVGRGEVVSQNQTDNSNPKESINDRQTHRHAAGKIAAPGPDRLRRRGLEVDVPMSTFYGLPHLGEKVALLTHFVVREDAQLLYGFSTGQSATPSAS